MNVEEVARQTRRSLSTSATESRQEKGAGEHDYSSISTTPLKSSLFDIRWMIRRRKGRRDNPILVFRQQYASLAKRKKVREETSSLVLRQTSIGPPFTIHEIFMNLEGRRDSRFQVFRHRRL